MKKLICKILILMILTILSVSCSSEAEKDSEIKESDYLVILYLSGDANNGDNFFPTLQQAEDALYEIRNDDGSVKRGYASVNVVALWDGPNEIHDYVHSDSRTRLLELGPGYHDFGDNTNSGLYGNGKLDWSLSEYTVDYSSSVSWIYKNGRQELNMGSQQTLTDFLTWTKENYKAETVILLFGDHGFGPTNQEEADAKALISDDDTNGDNSDPYYLTTSKIRNALKDSGYCGKEKIDLIIEDLCLQSSIDETFGLLGCADYFLAAENTTMGNSLGCYNLIKDMRKNTPILKIAKNQVSYFKNKWKDCEIISMQTFALTDLTKTEAFNRLKDNSGLLAEAIEELGETSYAEIVKDLRSDSNEYGFFISASYAESRDFGLMSEALGNKYPSLKPITDAILEDLKKVIVKSYASGYNRIQGESFNYQIEENPIYGLTISVNKLVKTPSYSEWTLFGKDNLWSTLIVDQP